MYFCFLHIFAVNMLLSALHSTAIWPKHTTQTRCIVLFKHQMAICTIVSSFQSRTAAYNSSQTKHVTITMSSSTYKANMGPLTFVSNIRNENSLKRENNGVLLAHLTQTYTNGAHHVPEKVLLPKKLHFLKLQQIKSFFCLSVQSPFEIINRATAVFSMRVTVKGV